MNRGASWDTIRSSSAHIHTYTHTYTHTHIHTYIGLVFDFGVEETIATGFKES